MNMKLLSKVFFGIALSYAGLGVLCRVLPEPPDPWKEATDDQPQEPAAE